MLSYCVMQRTIHAPRASSSIGDAVPVLNRLDVANVIELGGRSGVNMASKFQTVSNIPPRCSNISETIDGPQ